MIEGETRQLAQELKVFQLLPKNDLMLWINEGRNLAGVNAAEISLAQFFAKIQKDPNPYVGVLFGDYKKGKPYKKYVVRRKTKTVELMEMTKPKVTGLAEIPLENPSIELFQLLFSLSQEANVPAIFLTIL